MVSSFPGQKRMSFFLNFQVIFNIVQTQTQEGQRLRVGSGLLLKPKLVKSKVDFPTGKREGRSSEGLDFL